MKRTATGAALMLAAALMLSGCGSDEEGQADQQSQAQACTYDETYDGIEVSGTGGQQPTIEVTGESQPATELGVLDLCPGDGAAVAESSVLSVNYMGVAQSTGDVFDSSYEGGTPVTFALEQVIDGWQQGLLGMQAGGTRLLVIPGDLAYGKESPGPGIGPDETLIFVVDLVGVQ